MILWVDWSCQAKKVEDQLAQKAQLISTNLRPALRVHSRQLHDDLLYSLLEHARTQLIYEKQVLREFERLQPELSAIVPRDAGIVYHHHHPPLSASPDPGPSPSMIRATAEQAQHSRRHSVSRTTEMARSVLVTKGEQDKRQTVDAKSAAASLARLF